MSAPRRRRAKGETTASSKPRVRCAIYTRKSSDEGLDQEFNSLDAQRESAEAFIASQRAEGWECLGSAPPEHFHAHVSMHIRAIHPVLLV